MKEITCRLQLGESTYSRPDVTCMVFKHKLTKLLKNIKAGKYFTLRADQKLDFIIHVIEYQYRGLPHAHICIRDPNAPPKWDHANVGEYIDSVISARFPDDMDEWPEYVQMLRKNMLHRCSDGPNGCIKDATNGRCKNNFDTNILRPSSCIDNDGFPQYRRLQEKDLVVVAHNIEALMDWGGHINFEYCGSCLTVIYLYKYLFKGSKKEKFRISNCDDIADDDEINLHIRGRVLTSMDACWRTFGYQTYPKSDPPVKSVRVVGEEEMKSLRHENKICDLLVWFHRPEGLMDVRFAQFYGKYKRSFIPPSRNTVYYTITDIPEFDKSVYITERADDVLTRMKMIYISVGELFYLRTLLLYVCATSYQELKTFNGNTYSTFQEAAYARNIVDDENECLKCMEENLVFCTPHELRSLFVTMTGQGFATLRILESNDIMMGMTTDFRLHLHSNDQITDGVLNLLYKDFQQRLADQGKTMVQVNYSTKTNVHLCKPSIIYLPYYYHVTCIYYNVVVWFTRTRKQ